MTPLLRSRTSVSSGHSGKRSHPPIGLPGCVRQEVARSAQYQRYHDKLESTNRDVYTKLQYINVHAKRAPGLLYNLQYKKSKEN